MHAGSEYCERSFWSIVDRLSGAPAGSSHQQRMEAAAALGLCFWDVLANVHLPGGPKVRQQAPRPNDLPAFLAAHPSVRRLAFNGQQAAAEARRHFPELMAGGGHQVVVLPSSSRGNTHMGADAKLAEWRKVVAGPP
jgi:TDG/mug DNA glycosylase family protein